MIYDNYKLNEIFHATWPNLGWAKKVNSNQKSEKTDSKNSK